MQTETREAIVSLLRLKGLSLFESPSLLRALLFDLVGPQDLQVTRALVAGLSQRLPQNLILRDHYSSEQSKPFMLIEGLEDPDWETYPYESMELWKSILDSYFGIAVMTTDKSSESARHTPSDRSEMPTKTLPPESMEFQRWLEIATFSFKAGVGLLLALIFTFKLTENLATRINTVIAQSLRLFRPLELSA